MKKSLKVILSILLAVVLVAGSIAVYSAKSGKLQHHATYSDNEKSPEKDTIEPQKATKDTITGSIDNNAVFVFDKRNGQFTVDCKGNLLSAFAFEYDDKVSYLHYDGQEELNGNNVQSVVFNDGVTVIGENPFCYFKNLKKVTFPKSTRRILRNCFPRIMKLDTIIFDGTEAEWNNIKIDRNGNEALLNCKNIQFTGDTKKVNSTDYEKYRYKTRHLREGKIFIEADYFTGETVVSGNGATEEPNDVDAEKLYDKLKDTSLELPEGNLFPATNVLKYSEGITEITSYNASGLCLLQLYLPKTLSKIDENAFEGNNDLTDIYYNGTKEQWDKIQIANKNDELRFATIHFNAKGSKSGIKESVYTTAATELQTKNNLTGRLDRNAVYNFNKKSGKLTINCKGNFIGTFSDDYGTGRFDFEKEYSQDTLKKYKVSTVAFGTGVTVIGSNIASCFPELKTVSLPTTTKRILSNSFPKNIKIDTVVYDGTEAEWKKIVIDNVNNDALLKCKNIIFNNNSAAKFNTENYRYKSIKYRNGKVTVRIDYFTGKVTISGSGDVDKIFKPTSPDYSPDSVMWNLMDSHLYSGRRDYAFEKTLKINDGIKTINDSILTASCFESIYLPKSINKIEKDNFNSGKFLTDVYYAGSKKQWESVKISKGNDDLKKAKIHYNTEY